MATRKQQTKRQEPITEPTIRLKQAAFDMNVSYEWLYKRVVTLKRLPFKRRGKIILIPLSKFRPWAAQDNIP